MKIENAVALAFLSAVLFIGGYSAAALFTGTYIVSVALGGAVVTFVFSLLNLMRYVR